MKRFFIIAIAVIFALGVHSCAAVRNVFDEMYYGHSDVGPFWLTRASYRNFGLQDIHHSVRYMVDHVVIEYMEKDLLGVGEHLNFKWFLKEDRLEFFYLCPSMKVGVMYVVDAIYSPKEHTLCYLPLRLSVNDDLSYESVDLFLESEGIERTFVEELLKESFFHRLSSRWIEVNGIRSRFTMDNIGEITIENHLWDNSDPVE